MRKNGFTIIEMFISATLLAIVSGGILGMLIATQYFLQDGIALAKSQATARQAAEKILRQAREGKNFTVLSGGNQVTVIGYDNSVDVYVFAGDTLTKNGNTFGSDIVGITGKNIFTEIAANEIFEINFGVRSEGMFGRQQEVQISTKVKLRNS